MLTSTIDSIKRENAIFARDTEYLKETALDDMIDERMESVEDQFDPETIEELEEAVHMVEQLSGDIDPVMESAEIDRILNAEDDISFNEMAGIE